MRVRARCGRVLPVVMIALAGSLAGGCSGPKQAGEKLEGRVVVLLHGLGRTSRSMKPLERFFSEKGFEVLNVDYPAKEKTIEELSEGLGAAIGPLCTDGDATLHFVTHSMGGVLLRYYMAHNACPALGRVVMLSPPNQGTELVDKLGGSRVFRMATGPSAQEMGTDPGSLPGRLGPVEFELGVIMGNRSINPIGSAIIPGQDDGIVGVESARVEGMRDFLLVPATHSFIMMNDDVVEQSHHFIETGSFHHDAASED